MTAVTSVRGGIVGPDRPSRTADDDGARAAARRVSAAIAAARLPADVHRDHHGRGLPVAAPALVHVRAEEHRTRSPRPARRSIRPTRSRSRTRARTCRCWSFRCRTGRRGHWPCSSRPAKSSTFIDPDHPDAAPIVWAGSWRTLAHVWDDRATLGELREGLGPHRFPAPAVQHGGDRGDLDDRDAALVHARGVRIRPVPIPRPEPAVHVADRHGLPARRGDDHPDLPRLPQDRLGRHLAAAPGARRSSPTPSTSS